MNAKRVLSLLGLVSLVLGILVVFTPVSAALAECKPDGIPAYAGTGVSGALDPKVETSSGGNYYGLYGWAGLRWNTCDLGGPIPDIMAEMDTWVGNALMGGAAGLASIMAALHKWTANPGPVLKPIDDKIADFSKVTVDLVFGNWAFALIVFAALGIFVFAFTRNVRRAGMTVIAVVCSLAFIGVVQSAPLQIAQSTDGVASGIVSIADQRAMELSGIPASAPDGGGIYANTQESTGAILRDGMLQPMWRMGQSGGTETAKKTEDMFKASTASWSEVSKGYKPETKRDAYNKAVDAVKNDDKTESQYQTVKGQSYNRTGAGFLALLMVGIVALIRIPAEAYMFLGMVVIRFIPILGPVFAGLAIPEPTRPAAMGALKIVAASIFNVIVFGIIASIHTAITAMLYVNPVNLFLNTLLSALITYLLLKLSKPYRSVTKLATGQAVSAALEDAPNGPGNALKGVVGMVTGTVIGSSISGANERRKEKKKDAMERQDRPHNGPDIHEGWKEAPPINPSWGDPNGDDSFEPGEGDTYQPDSRIEADSADEFQPENYPYHDYRDEDSGLVLEQERLTMPDFLFEPEFEDGRMQTTIFIPPAEPNLVEIGTSDQIQAENI